MKKIILLIICTCILSSCRLNEERKAVPEDKEEFRLMVQPIYDMYGMPYEGVFVQIRQMDIPNF